ncbi:MAG TPA: diguanylate cyclase [Xanthomonadaceae bacterium]
MDAAARLAELLADPALATSPLAKLCEEVIADQARLHRRLERISRISDRYQGDLIHTNRELASANGKLEAALADVHTLSGFIPICSQCKRVRDDGGFWDEVETYIGKHSEVVMGHSVCPDCLGRTERRKRPELRASAQHLDAEGEQQHLADVLANEAWKDHPLTGEYQRLSLGYQKLTRRLDKISRISDGFQAQLKHLNHALAVASLTDPLTGLPNRRAMIERLEHAAAITAKDGGKFSIAMIDIDFFKKVNDTYGHDVGDAAIRSLADTLKANRREQDFAARWGGEEFLLLMLDSAAASARHWCDSLRATVETACIQHQETRIGITISVGVAAHERVLSFEETIKDADRALYAAKAAGRNQVISAEDL